MPISKIALERPLVSPNCTLGEGPLYDTRTSQLHFVDIVERKVFHLDISTLELSSETFDIPITCLALRRDKPGLACTTAQGFAILEGNSRYTYLSQPFSADIAPHIRFNDGACDDQGRYFAGSVYNKDLNIPGKLYCYDPSDKTCKVVDDGPFTDSNGIGWSPLRRYFTDSIVDRIYAYDFENGQLSNRRLFAHGENHGLPSLTYPDGLCVDDEGGVWSARWGASKVSRYTRTGTIDFEIELPTALIPTAACFGGPNLDQMYITTAHTGAMGGDSSRQEKYPDSGQLFTVDLKEKFKGVKRGEFAG